MRGQEAGLAKEEVSDILAGDGKIAHLFYSVIKSLTPTLYSTYTANNFGLMYSRKRISQNSFPNYIHIIPKSFMVFCQELHNPKRNYENQI
jgi:hypothetical protein